MYLFSIDRSKYDFIEADNKNIKYMGRIDFKDKKSPTIIYAGSIIMAKFEGTSIKIALKNKSLYRENYIGYILDRTISGKLLINRNDKKIVINIMGGLKDQVHEIIIFKRQDACHYFDFYGLILDKGCKLLSLGPRSNRRIECFGDSIATGELCEYKEDLGKEPLESLKRRFSNTGYSFPVILSRYLNAELNNNAQSGLGVLNKTGLFGNNEHLGLEFTFDKLRYNPELGECSEWDFSTYIPHIVIMEFGHFDLYTDNPINDYEEHKENWKDRYKKVIIKLRKKYPKALFILISSIIKHDEFFDQAMDELQEELNDKKVVRYKFIRNGTGPEKYLSIYNQAEMADELSMFINAFGNDIWED